MNDLTAKIMAVIERLGATEMAAEIIVDLVKTGLGRLGGRPRKPVINQLQTGLQPVAKPLDSASSDLGSSLSLFSPEPSKPNEEIINTMEVYPPVGEHKVPSAPNLFNRVLRQFCETWRTRYGVYYEPTAADRNQLGRLLKTLSPEVVQELPKAFQAYLGDLTPWVAQEMRHNLRHFCTSGGVNTYRANAPILSAKEARSIAAGEQWEAMHNGAKR